MKKNPILLIAINIAIVFTLNSCVTCKDCTQLKADYIGFSDNVYPSYNLFRAAFAEKNTYSPNNKLPNYRETNEPFDLETQKGKVDFKNGLKNLESGEKTSAYYALDKGLDRLKNVRRKYMGRSKKAKYYIITLTDGLDNNSSVLGKIKGANKAERDLIYEQKLQKKLSTVMGNSRNQFQSFVMYYDAKDSYVLNEKGEKEYYSEEEIKDKLKVFSYGKNATTPKVIYIQHGKIDTLAERFNEEFKQQSFEFKISKGYLGERIKMQLKNAENDSIEIEGLFEQEGRKFYLSDVKTSNGVSYDQLLHRKIVMSIYNDPYADDVLFDIRSLKYMDKVFYVEKEYQFISINKNNWYPNVEYKASSSELTDAYILVILDVSKSFTVLDDAKDQVMKIIDEITKK